jgi:hypothetical protein
MGAMSLTGRFNWEIRHNLPVDMNFRIGGEKQYKKIFVDQRQILITQGPTSGADRRALDDATEEMINYTERMGIDTIFS